MVLATFSQKRNQKPRQKAMDKHPTHRLVDENHTKLRVFKLLTKSPKNKTTHPTAADARATLLLWLVLMLSCF